jgi:chemotaxis methyl-accepting protein methylase
MKDYYNKKEAIEVPVPLPKRSTPAATAATIDAMLDKMAELIRQRTAWANLAKLLLVRGSYDSTDEEIRIAFAACNPEGKP